MGWLAMVVALTACAGDGLDDEDADNVGSDAYELAPGGGKYSMRFETAIPMCTVAQLEANQGCPNDDPKCLCRPEFDALNAPKGSTGNPSGKILMISQPEYGPRGDGSFAFDAYAAIKKAGNFVGHYVNALNPSLSCSAAQSWTSAGCSGGSGCGWRCIGGADRADQIVDQVNATYAGRVVPHWVSLNEAWSLLYREDGAGVAYRTWIRNLTKRMAARGKRPLLLVQERHAAAGPFTLLSETSRYAWIGVESYLSGREVLAAPGQCLAPFDASNWCHRKYDEIRSAVRNSADPPIAFDRLVMVEHYATNLYQSEGTTRGWGRAFDDDPASPSHGTPTTSTWKSIITRRAKAMKSLPQLGGVASYAWAGNDSGTGSRYRVEFANAYSSVKLP